MPSQITKDIKKKEKSEVKPQKKIEKEPEMCCYCENKFLDIAQHKINDHSLKYSNKERKWIKGNSKKKVMPDDRILGQPLLDNMSLEM